jgi:Flp pilus assembly protein TadD
MSHVHPAVVVVALAGALSGCAGHGQTPASADAAPPQPAPVVHCNAQPAQFAVGKASTASVMETARARSGAQIARILRPGQMVTKEFNAQRLNLQVDESGRVLSVSCG